MPPATPPVLRQPNIGAVAVVGWRYCTPNPKDLTITRKNIGFSNVGEFVVTDNNDNLLLQVKKKALSLRNKCVLLDALGNPVVNFQRKLMSVHGRRNVFRGDATNLVDLLFTVKRSSLIQLKPKLDVFLARNTREKGCDFKVEGSYFQRSCTIRLGHSESMIAVMYKKFGLWKSTYKVTVFPNVDYAFIVTLIVILEQINKDGGEW